MILVNVVQHHVVQGQKVLQLRLREASLQQERNEELKGLSHELDWAFDDINRQIVGLNKRRAWFLMSLRIHRAICIFLPVNVSLGWLVLAALFCIYTNCPYALGQVICRPFQRQN